VELHAGDGLPLDAEEERRLFARVVRRLVPFAFLCYVVAYVDRVNIGFAAAAMQEDLGLSDAHYGLGAGLFFLGYFLFEVPSNLLLERYGARRWLARILVTWGLLSMAMMLVQGVTSFYLLRITLGLAEAGFFPGMVLYLTYWFPARERARVGALFMAAAPVAMVVGAPLSEGLLALDGRLGLQGWQWLFLLEGLPAVVLGAAALRVLTDRPEDAAWLDARERAWLARVMASDRAPRGPAAWSWRSLLDARVVVLCVIYFANTTATYGIFLWLPKILKEASGYEGLRLALITAIPFAVALVGMVAVGAHSDRTQERRLHLAACAAVGAAGLVLAASAGRNVPLIVLAFTICQLGQRAILAVFWSIPPLLLGGTAAAAGIAMINAIGNLGGFVGPTLVGFLRSSDQGYERGLLALAAGLVLEALLAASLRLPRAKAAA
jgi:ACS family tartrate transporter-like MFS transporter